MKPGQLPPKQRTFIIRLPPPLAVNPDIADVDMLELKCTIAIGLWRAYGFINEARETILRGELSALIAKYK